VTLTLTATALVVGYVLLCWIKPFGRCWRCRRTGSHKRLITRRLRTCRRCRGSGLRLRHGRRIFNYFARIHREAHTRTTVRPPSTKDWA
jgi:hypothetical protein